MLLHTQRYRSTHREAPKHKTAQATSSLSFVQISDTHIGFNKPANDHVTETLQQTIAAINSLPTPPSFVVHTGDITHLSKSEEFDRSSKSATWTLTASPGSVYCGEPKERAKKHFPQKRVMKIDVISMA